MKKENFDQLKRTMIKGGAPTLCGLSFTEEQYTEIVSILEQRINEILEYKRVCIDARRESNDIKIIQL